MKKLLLGTAVAAMGFAFAAPASAANGVKLELGGHYKGYVFWQDQDVDAAADAAGLDARSIDAVREPEIHFTGETTLDNGMTVGAHFEIQAGGQYAGRMGNTNDGQFEESYLYFSGSWGRVNFGAEDGAAYLLQVAAPSADSNYDGIRQYVSPFNYDATLTNAPTGTAHLTPLGGTTTTTAVDTVFDYAQDLTVYKEKITYLTPVLNGFQAGVSYTPEMGWDNGYNGAFGTNIDDQNNDLGSGYEVAARYEGMFQQVGFVIGGGYTLIDLEDTTAASGHDDNEAWNVGADFNFGPFGLGVVYTEDNQARDNDSDKQTWVVGADYTTGPFKIGASYLNRDEELGTGAGDWETDRYTGGVTYTYGPGMTFRGSISYIEHDAPAGNGEDMDGTAVLLGTQIDF
ncbi:MAG: porin [Alphaproteobacteria bacterium]|nr:porin [Alphaproteobacteria bacterium]